MDESPQTQVKQANAIIDDVLKSVSEFRAAAKARFVPLANINEIGRDIVRRIARLR